MKSKSNYVIDPRPKFLRDSHKLNNISIIYDLGLRLPRDVFERDQEISFIVFFKFGKNLEIDLEKNKIFSSPEMQLAERMKHCVAEIST